ncbi:hypothetical protein L208DRAFT_1278429, partial [Tricholoma matsutake]
KPVFTKKENAMLAQWIKILDWHHKSLEKNQTKTVAHWNEIYLNLCLKQPIISAWLSRPIFLTGIPIVSPHLSRPPCFTAHLLSAALPRVDILSFQIQ